MAKDNLFSLIQRIERKTVDTKPYIEQNSFSSNLAQEGRLSRHQFITLLTAVGGAAVLSACRSVETQAPSISATATLPSTPQPLISEPPVFNGYSIFYQTMVDMSWLEIKASAQAGAIILLPIGVIEEHGPHMGLGVDTYLTYLFCKLIRHALEDKGIKTLIAPPYYWGINESTGSFPGSFTVRAETMKAVLYDIHSSLLHWGFKYVFSVSLHGDPTHNNVLMEATQKAREELGIGAFVVTPQGPDFPGASLLTQKMDVHAGAYETAEMVAEFPMDVNVELAKTLKPNYGFEPLGYYGDPAQFVVLDIEQIKKWAEACGVATADWIEAFLKTQK